MSESVLPMSADPAARPMLRRVHTSDPRSLVRLLAFPHFSEPREKVVSAGTPGETRGAPRRTRLQANTGVGNYLPKAP